MAGAREKIYQWLDDRLSLSPVLELAEHKAVPVHRFMPFYYFGGMTLFFFVVQVATGILLMLYYRPSAEQAFESVEFIMTTVHFGWLVRSIHSWSANLMVFFAFVHLVTAYFMKAYRRPRELTWMTGCIALFLALAFGFSGYLLPWNQLAFFATKVGTDIAGSVPLIGEWVLRFLRGGERVTGGTLSRFYGWHVAILPAITVVLLGLHLFLLQLHGMSVPPKEELEGKKGKKLGEMKFLPHFLLRELFGWALALAVLATLAALLPWELGEKADPFAPAYKDIRPEWYFVFMFETLKLVPGGEIAGLEYEAIAILAFGLGGLVLLLVPFLDRGVLVHGKSPLFTAAGVVVLIYVVGMTAWGYRSLLPVWIVLGTAALIAALGFATVTRKGPGAPALALALLVGAFLAAMPVEAQPREGAEPVTSCVACHTNPDYFDDEAMAIVHQVAEGIHGQVGLSCQDCHGGNPDPELAEDPDLAMDPDYIANPYRGAPERTAIPAFCGRCHSDPTYMRHFQPDVRVDQEQEYWTSQHGQTLKKGDTAVATCVDCHGVHGILDTENTASPVYPTHIAETCRRCHEDAARMAGRTLPDGRPLPLDQYSRWQRSVHANALLVREDLSAPTCNDCHGNHGATPPGLDSIAFVCGQCHGREADLFRNSVKQELLEGHNDYLREAGSEGCAACHSEPQNAASFTALTSFSECTSCHGNHAIVRPTVALLAPLPDAPCTFCHEGAALEGAGDGLDEPVARRRHYEQTLEGLMAEAANRGIEGVDRFDWLVDQAQQLSFHTLEGSASGEGGEGLELRPEFQRLFSKFRIGKIHFTYTDPVSGEEVRASILRCNSCHGGEGEITDSVGLTTASFFVERSRELTALTARAERSLLAARRGGVETRGALAELDQAVDAQIELEVLVHTFSAAADGPFAEKHAEGLAHARNALEEAQQALAELSERRRGLGVFLVLTFIVLLALGLKIRQLGS